MHVAWLPALLMMALPGGALRSWEDEVVYVVIIEKFFDGDLSNNHMRDQVLSRIVPASRGDSGGET